MKVVIVDESSDILDSFVNPPSELDQGIPKIVQHNKLKENFILGTFGITEFLFNNIFG